MPRLKAQRLLDRVDTGEIQLHPDTLHDTVLAATDNAKLAEEYRIAAIKSKRRDGDAP